MSAATAVVLAMVLQVPAPNAAEARAAELAEQRVAIEQRERTELAHVAEKLRAGGD